MAALDLAAVMADIATAVQTVLGTGTAHGYPAEGAEPGDAVVGYPEGPQPLTGTFGRGMDRTTVPLWVICGMPQDSATRSVISTWVGNSSSVVTAVQGYAGTWSSVQVTEFAIETLALTGWPELLAVKFTVDVIS